MRNLILFTLSTLAFLIHPLFLPAQNSFSFSIEANSAAGDQAVTSVNVSPDFDGDGIVGFSDFLALSGLFGARQGDGRYEAKYDLDSDGAIGFSDFLIFSASFGKEVSPLMVQRRLPFQMRIYVLLSRTVSVKRAMHQSRRQRWRA